MRSSVLRTASAITASLCLLGSCQVPNSRADVDAPGSPGLHAYALAKAEWLAYRSTPQTVESRQTRLEATLRHLDVALAQDPGVPLFWQCRGRVLQDLGEVAESRHCFESALRRCPDWFPGWLWMALVHLQERDRALAQRAVEAAWTSIDNLRHGDGSADVTLFGVPVVTTVEPGLRDDHADSRTGALRTMQQVHEALQWDGQDDKMAAASLIDILRGYAHYAEFGLVQYRSPDDVAAMEQRLQAALRLAPDLWEARYWRAWLAWDRRDYDTAERLLRAYYFDEVKSGHHEALVRTVYLRACTDAWLDHPDDERRERASHAFRRLHDRSVHYEPKDDPVLAAAEQLFVPDERRTETVHALRQWAPDNVRDQRIRSQLLSAFESASPLANGGAR